MLQLLEAREYGFDPPWLLPKVFQHQRYTKAELVADCEFARGHKRGVASLDIDKQNGRYVISGGRDKDGTILIHDTSPQALEQPTQPPPSARQVGRGVPFHPIVARVVVSSCSPQASGPPAPPPRHHAHQSDHASYAVSVVQWYPHDTGLFTTSSADNSLKVWDTNQLVVVESFSFKKKVYTHALAASEAHSLIAVGGADCKITLCDMMSGSSTHILRHHTQPVFALAWSPDSSHLLASAGADGSVVLWDVRRASGPLRALDMHNGSGASNSASASIAHSDCVNGLNFTSDGLYLVSFGSDNALRLWDTASGKNTLINYGHILNTATKQTVQFSCTPHTSSLQPLALLPSGGELVIVELMTGKKLKNLHGHYGSVNCVAGHPVEQEFISGGSDRNLLSWAPPSPAAQVSESGRNPRAARPGGMGVYADAWSSDED